MATVDMVDTTMACLLLRVRQDTAEDTAADTAAGTAVDPAAITVQRLHPRRRQSTTTLRILVTSTWLMVAKAPHRLVNLRFLRTWLMVMRQEPFPHPLRLMTALLVQVPLWLMVIRRIPHPTSSPIRMILRRFMRVFLMIPALPLRPRRRILQRQLLITL